MSIYDRLCRPRCKILKKYTNSFPFIKSMMTVFSWLRKIASQQLHIIRQYQGRLVLHMGVCKNIYKLEIKNMSEALYVRLDSRCIA